MKTRGSVRPGKFRVYLGAAAGVGKTCAMLDEGWRRFQRGADVVVGFVETHKRPYTMEQIRDLPVVPRKNVEYRDAEWEEMDIDAVMARQPEVALIDELAHTNVPGSGRHAKRWRTSSRSSMPGIAVITTVNIQHIESVADAVERITGVGVRERVPDWVVRRADQIELIDSSADQLRRRMLHGNIYPERRCRLPSTGSSGPRTSPRCASSPCVSSPTRPRRSSSSTSAPRGPAASCGRRPSGSWSP